MTESKVVPVHCAMKTMGSRGIAPLFVISGLDGGECQLHVPVALPPGKDRADTHWVGGWVDPSAGLYVEKRQTYLPLDSNPGRPARSYTE
jgi:hypothetical protein